MTIPDRLRDILMLRDEEMQTVFASGTRYQKTLFLEAATDMINEFLIENPDPDIGYIPLDITEGRFLGNCINFILDLYDIHKEKVNFIEIGWQSYHGKCFQYFEFEDDELFVSYFSERHIKNEFKHKYDLFTEDRIHYGRELYKLEFDDAEELKTPINEFLKSISKQA